jgi:putative SOS response-associated peptidase YedK
MCGRYTLHTEKEALAERFDFDPGDLATLAPRYNVAPTQNAVTVRADGTARVASLMRWGLVPSWAKAIAGLPQMINARAEGIEAKPSFRQPFRKQRCLILADGFYEWQAPVAPAKRKIPHFIGLASGEPFAMAGLWSIWQPKDELGDERMPVILPRDAEARWLDSALDGNVEALQALLVPVGSDALRAHPISTRVNAVRNDDPSLLEESDADPQLGFL